DDLVTGVQTCALPISHPETLQCMSAPPRSSSVVFSPIAISTMRGLPTYREALPSTMMTTSVSAGRYAEPAGDGPNSTQTCGTTPDRKSTRLNSSHQII